MINRLRSKFILMGGVAFLLTTFCSISNAIYDCGSKNRIIVTNRSDITWTCDGLYQNGVTLAPGENNEKKCGTICYNGFNNLRCKPVDENILEINSDVNSKCRLATDNEIPSKQAYYCYIHGNRTDDNYKFTGSYEE